MKPVRRSMLASMRAVRLTPKLLKRAVGKAWGDRVLGLSAEAAFWQMLSLPSLFLALIASLGYVSRWFGTGTVDRTERQIENTLSRGFSQEVVEQVIAPTLREVLRGERADVISISFILALWAGSSATATFVNTITIAYGQRDLRGPVRSRLLALWLFLGTVVLGVFLLPLLVLGPDLLRRIFPESVRDTVSTFIDLGYYPVVVLLLMFGLTTLYKVAPPRRLPWHRGLPGATLALLVFLAGSAGLREYIAFILDQNHAYGTLAAPIAALLYFFALALGVLLGAEFNAVVEEHKPARTRQPRVLDPRHWQVFSGPVPVVEPDAGPGAEPDPEPDSEPAAGTTSPDPAADADQGASPAADPESVRAAPVSRRTVRRARQARKLS